MNCAAFSWHDLGITAIVLIVLAIAIVAYLVQITRYAYCWWRLIRTCGGHVQALGVCWGLQAAKDLDTDERIRRAMRAAESLRLVKR